MKFAEEGPNAGLEIRFNREIPGGWIITRESAEKVRSITPVLCKHEFFSL